MPAAVQADTHSFQYNDKSSLSAIFEAYPEQIACVIMMPFELEKPSPGYLQKVKEVAHEHGALFILDEMRSGFRLALGGAQEYFGIQADLTTYSKAMSNGHPISAIVGRSDILSGIGRTKMTSTFFGNSAEMAAAITTITILRDTDAIAHIWKMGELFEQGMKDLIRKYAVPAEFIGYPPYPFVRFILPDEVKNERLKEAFYIETTRSGVLFHPNHHWYISAAHTESNIMETLEICRKAFEVACSVVSA